MKRLSLVFRILFISLTLIIINSCGDTEDLGNGKGGASQPKGEKKNSNSSSGSKKDNSTPSSSQTSNGTKPTKPSNIKASKITRNRITLTWDASTLKDGTIWRYFISYKTTGDYGNISNTTLLKKDIYLLTEDTAYTFRIRAMGSNNQYSEYSEKTISTLSEANDKPTTPSSVTLKNITENSMEINWGISNYDEGHIEAYYISYKTSGSYGDERETYTTELRSRKSIIKNLKPNTAYTFRVRSKNNKGIYSEYRESATASTLAGKAITAPSNIKMQSVGANTITLRWDSSSDGTYYISYKTTGDYGSEQSTTAKISTISNLTPNTLYSFRIRLKGNNGKYSKYAYISSLKTTSVTFSYNPITSTITNRVWLDRNLGASRVCESATDIYCYGDYYQWGRNTDGHEKSSSDTTSTLSTDITSTTNNKFITTDYENARSDWAHGADSDGLKRKDLWNPCPSGYKIPTLEELRAEKITNQADAYNKFKLPFAGSRDSFTASMKNIGLIGSIWSNSPLDGAKSYKSYNMYFNTSSSYTTDVFRGDAYSIRCINQN